MVQCMDLESDSLGLHSSTASFLSSLALGFSTCKMGVHLVLNSSGCCEDDYR